MTYKESIYHLSFVICHLPLKKNLLVPISSSMANGKLQMINDKCFPYRSCLLSSVSCLLSSPIDPIGYKC
jgi:hypothetical protein